MLYGNCRMWALIGGLLLGGCAGLGEDGSQVVARRQASSKPSTQLGPWVILQAGLGDDASSWRAIERGLEGRYPVLSLDRPGYGRTPLLDGPRDPCTVATELRAQLKAAGMPPPYLLVGHSLGGLYQFAFARLYPEEVAGLLLIEPTHPAHWQRLQAEAPALATFVRVMRASSFSAAARREFDDQAACNARLLAPSVTPLPPSRLLVRASFSNPMETGAFEQLMRQEWLDWLSLSGAPAVERVSGTGHYIHQEQTVKVQRVIETMAAASRRAPAP